MNRGKVLLGLAASASAGAVLGILFAPEKGSVTRRQISQKAENLLDNLKSRFDESLVTATSELKETKSKADDMLDKGHEKAQKVKKEIKSRADQL